MEKKWPFKDLFTLLIKLCFYLPQTTHPLNTTHSGEWGHSASASVELELKDSEENK